MKEAAKMLDVLKRECGEAQEQFLSDICDNCYWLFALAHEELDEKCSECTVESDLEALLQKARTIAVGETMQITAEEMFPKEVNKHDSD